MKIASSHKTAGQSEARSPIARLGAYLTRTALSPAIALAATGLILTTFATSSALNQDNRKESPADAAGSIVVEASSFDESAKSQTKISTGSQSQQATTGDKQTSQPQATNGSSASISIKSTTRSSGNTTVSEPIIEVDGQTYEIPDNGKLRKDIRGENSRTKIHAKIDNDNTSNSSISISTNIQTTGDGL